MKKTRITHLSLIVLILLLGAGLARNAGAEVRVNASLHTPNMHLRIGNAPARPYPGIMSGHLRLARRHHYRVTARDRMIALRLARYTGVPAARLIRIRSYGYNWFEIGRWLHLPRPVIRAAMHPRSWNRYLRGQGRFAGRVVYQYEKLR